MTVDEGNWAIWRAIAGWDTVATPAAVWSPEKIASERARQRSPIAYRGPWPPVREHAALPRCDVWLGPDD